MNQEVIGSEPKPAQRKMSPNVKQYIRAWEKHKAEKAKSKAGSVPTAAKKLQPKIQVCRASEEMVRSAFRGHLKICLSTSAQSSPGNGTKNGTKVPPASNHKEKRADVVRNLSRDLDALLGKVGKTLG